MRSVKTNRLDCKTGVNRANKHSLALLWYKLYQNYRRANSFWCSQMPACAGTVILESTKYVLSESLPEFTRVHTANLFSFYLQKLTNVEPHLPERETWNRVLRCCYATPDRKHASSTRRATPDEVNQEKSTEIHQVDITQNVQNI